MKKIGFDIGAGNGGTFYKFKNCEKIYAFEPFYDGYNEILNKNIDNVEVYNLGISSVPGIKLFNAYNIGNPPAHGCGSFLQLDDAGEFTKVLENRYNQKFNCFSYEIECIRLDEFIKNKNIEYIEHIKIDTQGSDYDVILSIGDELNKVKTIETEIILKDFYKNQGTKIQIEEYLKKYNFNLLEEIWNDEAEGYETNCIFINNRFK